MRDRQLFVERQLTNGIRTFTYEDDTPYTHITVSVPVGSAHNTAGITPGTFHFLEHMVTLRSKRHPGFKEWDKLVGLKGGNFSATTYAFDTRYGLKISPKHLPEVLAGFFSQIFQPLMTEEDVHLQQGIISNERRRKERWFPGHDELTYYIYTQWQRDHPMRLGQILGSDEDLQAMTVTSLQAAHQQYFDRNVWVMIGGAGGAEAFLEAMSSVSTSEHILPQCYQPISWVKQEYHRCAFRDVARFELRYGGVIDTKPDPLLTQALHFILGYLTNTVHGPLYEWLREEKGWLYEIGWFLGVTRYSSDWLIKLPLSNLAQVDTVRQEISDRINAALSDNTAVAREVERTHGWLDTFQWLTLDSIMHTAQQELNDYGRIFTEQELRQDLERLRSVSLLQEVWQQYASPERVGSFCATPLEE